MCTCACVCLHPWGRSEQWCSGVMRCTFLWIHTWPPQTPQIAPPLPPPSSYQLRRESPCEILSGALPTSWVKTQQLCCFYPSSSPKTAQFFGTLAYVQPKCFQQYLNISDQPADNNLCHCWNDWHQRCHVRVRGPWCGGSITHSVQVHIKPAQL